MNRYHVHFALTALAYDIFNPIGTISVDALDDSHAQNIVMELLPDTEFDITEIDEVLMNPIPEAGTMPTLNDCFGCDPWDEENHGKHPASREED